MKRLWASPLVRVLLKGLGLFVIANLAFALLDPMALLGRISLYNGVFPGRERLPFGYRPEKAYNLVVDNLDAMLVSHAVGAPKRANEFRVLILGDSSVWGVLLQPADTLAGRLNALDLRAPDGRRMRFYNLGYPDFSVTKDLLLLQRGLDVKPDLVMWLVTLNSLPTDRQIEHLLVRSNPAEARELIRRFGLGLNPADPQFDAPGLINRTIVGERRNLADLLRLQMLGVPWAATGIDQDYPEAYDPITLDLEADDAIRGLTQPTLSDDEFRLDVVTAGYRLALERGVRLIIINEPMAISAGKNSDIRYNAFYPRWAYDQYRERLATAMRGAGAPYLDLWDIAPAAEFTNSPVHLNPAGSAKLAARIAEALPGWVR